MSKKGFIPACIILFSFIALFSGCATMNDVVRVKEDGSEGTAKIYPVTADQAWEISKTVFRWEGSDAIEEHKDTVVTKRRVTVNIATTLTETTYHKRFAQAVDIVKQGKPLPRNVPE